MASVKTVTEKFYAILVEQLGTDDEDITPDASFNEDLGCDSLDHIEILMACEEEFDLEISDEDGEKLARVQDALSYLEQRLLAKATR